jgi:hypothetical protein
MKHKGLLHGFKDFKDLRIFFDKKEIKKILKSLKSLNPCKG